MSKITNWLVAIAAVVIALAQITTTVLDVRRHATPDLSAAFHSVALLNGQVFFAHIETLNSEYVVLRDVYFVQSRVDPETKQTKNSLIKRGSEANGADQMILNRQGVMAIETIKDNSEVAKMIADYAKNAK